MFEGIAIVAPYTGAWIEINVENIDLSTFLKSHPTRVRGLKYGLPDTPHDWNEVAPYTGAWIEI